jgi:hypothetical protein
MNSLLPALKRQVIVPHTPVRRPLASLKIQLLDLETICRQ